jgi:hypothetical protein
LQALEFAVESCQVLLSAQLKIAAVCESSGASRPACATDNGVAHSLKQSTSCAAPAAAFPLRFQETRSMVPENHIDRDRTGIEAGALQMLLEGMVRQARHLVRGVGSGQKISPRRDARAVIETPGEISGGECDGLHRFTAGK